MFIFSWCIYHLVTAPHIFALSADTFTFLLQKDFKDFINYVKLPTQYTDPDRSFCLYCFSLEQFQERRQ
jgi:hypothetical protein